MTINNYDNMEKFIESVFNVFQLVNKKAELKNDKKQKLIALLIYNYVRNLSKEYNVELKIINSLEQEYINLIPIFEYISYNSIKLYDFSTIEFNDVDVSKKSDLERFVLTHIYYLTQNSI